MSATLTRTGVQGSHASTARGRLIDVLSHRDQMSAAAREHAKRFHADRYAERVEGLISV